VRSALLINGAQAHAPMASGRLNALLVETARSELEAHFSILTTWVQDGYDVAAEQRECLEASVVVFQFPVFWFAVPPSLKKYIDDVYAYGTFFGPTAVYGRGGLLGGRQYLVSTTWNAARNDFDSPDTIIGRRTSDDVLLSFHLTQQYVGLNPLASFSEYDVVQRSDADGSKNRLRTLRSVRSCSFRWRRC
jgi:NADPH dehydrogenase (quinone)